MQTTRAILVAFLLSLVATSVTAAPRCPGGRTASGECVDPDVTDAGQKDALLATQSKLSMTAPQVLPGDPDEGKYRYNHAETRAFFVDPITGARTTPQTICFTMCP